MKILLLEKVEIGAVPVPAVASMAGGFFKDAEFLKKADEA